MASLNSDCVILAGVGKATLEKLEYLKIHRVIDLLFHLPNSYRDKTCITPIDKVVVDQYAIIEGEVIDVKIKQGRRRQFHCIVQGRSPNESLKSPLILLCFFHAIPFHQSSLKIGVAVRCYGKVQSIGYQLEMVHPEYHQLSDPELPVLAKRLTPIYPTTKGLTQKTWQHLMAQALDLMQTVSFDYLPLRVQQKLNVLPLHEAIAWVHSPPKGINLMQLRSAQYPAMKRLILDELIAHQLGLRSIRHQVKQQSSIAMVSDIKAKTQLLESLAFNLTAAQQRVLVEIESDMAQNKPMSRLLQGDVGSGKTVVALLSALIAMMNDTQVVLMVPTAVLAQQHYAYFSQQFEGFEVTVSLLTGKDKGKARQEKIVAIQRGAVQIIIGTHAVIQHDVIFSQLGLVIIDEQHRFGVHQRLALQEKGDAHCVPHQLVMTATPIPRTLAMTYYADLDCSVIDELPAGRKPIQTLMQSQAKRDQLVARIQDLCQSGHQVYWVCTLIEESESLQCQAAENTFQALKEHLDGLHIALVHGKMKASEKESVMADFSAGKYQVLVATTVIEVGINVPNANLMVIENPERLGLSQLHQLRGRVGRGSVQSFCVLLYGSDLSYTSKQRLAQFKATEDGFKIAQIDLKLRGSGELLGVQQTGMVQFKVADLLRDQNLISTANDMADDLLVHHPVAARDIMMYWFGSKLECGMV